MHDKIKFYLSLNISKNENEKLFSYKYTQKVWLAAERKYA